MFNFGLGVAMVALATAGIGSGEKLHPSASEAMRQFEDAAKARSDRTGKLAVNVCRFQLAQSLAGAGAANRLVESYKGEGSDMLTLVCLGYLSAADDILKSRTFSKSR